MKFGQSGNLGWGVRFALRYDDELVVIIVVAMGDGDAFALERFSWTKNTEKVGVDFFAVRGLGVGKIAVVDRINIAMNRVAAAEWAVDNDFENLVQILCEIHIFIIAQKWGKNRMIRRVYRQIA